MQFFSLWGPFHVILFNSVIFLLALSHLKAVFCDPGLVPISKIRIDVEDDEEEWTVCSRCESYRPPRAHHCRICKRCIRRMDHHCPWINVSRAYEAHTHLQSSTLRSHLINCLLLITELCRRTESKVFFAIPCVCWHFIRLFRGAGYPLLDISLYWRCLSHWWDANANVINAFVPHHLNHNN